MEEKGGKGKEGERPGPQILWPRTAHAENRSPSSHLADRN